MLGVVLVGKKIFCIFVPKLTLSITSEINDSILMKKKVLIDLYSLENPFCGFGQIAVNYAKLFADVQRSGKEDFDIVFLLPDCYRHRPLDEFEGVECFFKDTKLHHMFHIVPNRLPKVDLWHSVNQFCRTYPTSEDTKLIYTIHDLNFLFEESGEVIALLIKDMQKHINQASCVTFISQYAEDISFCHLNLRGKDTRVIYNGVESLTDRPMEKPRFVVNDKPFFFALGQFLPKKNFHLLVDVMKEFPDMQLYLCGQCHTTYGSEIISRMAMEGVDNITIASNISNEERIWLFSHCQAYLFPSIGEGFGLPMIEAMQFGKAVFSSKAQSLPEIGHGYSLIWPSLEPKAMAAFIKEHLNAFYKDPQRIQEMVSYANSFSYQKHVEAYLQLYRELLAQ